MTEEPKVAGALATSIEAIDASRRVGWAKAFAAEESLDTVSRDYNIVRSDLDAVLRFTAYLYTAVCIHCPELLALLPKTIDKSLIMSIMPDREIRAGKRAANRLRERLMKKPGDVEYVDVERFKAVQKIARDWERVAHRNQAAADQLEAQRVVRVNEADAFISQLHQLQRENRRLIEKANKLEHANTLLIRDFCLKVETKSA